VLFECCVRGEHERRVAHRLQQPGADFRLVGAQEQDGIVELARHGERPPRGAESANCFGLVRLRRYRSVDHDRCIPRLPVDAHVDVLVAIACGVDLALERREHDAFRVPRPVALRRELQRATLQRFLELLRLG
jgi:hypothetical protein